MDDNQRNLKHSDLLYDYIKFHLGLYLATPTVVAIVATALGVQSDPSFQVGMASFVVIYFVAGVHASWTIASCVNVDWKTGDEWADLGKQASSIRRRFFHHYLYFVGLLLGLGGIAAAWLSRMAGKGV